MLLKLLERIVEWLLDVPTDLALLELLDGTTLDEVVVLRLEELLGGSVE